MPLSAKESGPSPNPSAISKPSEKALLTSSRDRHPGFLPLKRIDKFYLLVDLYNAPLFLSFAKHQSTPTDNHFPILTKLSFF
jgi:hypothetical protein